MLLRAVQSANGGNITAGTIGEAAEDVLLLPMRVNHIRPPDTEDAPNACKDSKRSNRTLLDDVRLDPGRSQLIGERSLVHENCRDFGIAHPRQVRHQGKSLDFGACPQVTRSNVQYPEGSG